ncbi:hypothetical protein N9404_01050 [Candidatus Pelagibacter sp.]|nr:hypothetical protein [Candidatus Pelagibacter sp.]
MSNFTESELIPAALKIILDKPNGIATKDLIIELRNLMNPSGEDLEMLSNRNDDKFSQKVRNIKSHKTLENKGYAKFYDDKFFITEKGVKFLNEVPSENLDEKLLINIHEEIPISIRTSNVLKDQGIIFIEQLLEYTEKQLLTFPGAGKGTIKEIENILYDLGFTINSKANLKNTNNKTNENKDLVLSSYEKKLEINILNDWPISERTYNALKSEEIIYLGDLLSINFNDLLKLRNFGRKSLKEIKEFLVKEDVEDILVDPVKWGKIRENLILKEKENKLSNIAIQNNLRGIRKTLFKDFEQFKDNYLSEEKIKIKKDISNIELEKLILEDINYALSLLSEKMNLVFKGRYGYMQNFETLEGLGKKLNVTRERVRQYESNINKTLIKIGKIDRYSLVEFFNKFKSISFHKLFPQLDINFTNTSHSNSGGDITRDRLVAFMESYCGVKENYFTTPERELWHFDSERLKEIFVFTPAGVSTEDFIEIIKDNYGYDDFTSNSALEFMNKKEFIKIVDEKVYPIKINKNEEVAHILLNYPDGLHWKEIGKIGNKSYTKNKWDLDRIVGDSSLSMTGNPHIYLIDKGKHRLIKYLLLEVEDKDQIVSLAIDLLNDLNLDQSDLEKIYKKIIEIEKYQNLNFYDFRAIIKIFGEEKGLYHSGKSGQNTISFNKDIKSISLKDKIREIIENSNDEISQQEINKKLQKSNEQLPLSTHLDILEDENVIFKINPGIYLNFKDAIRLCDQKEVEEYLDEVLDRYEFITSVFIREKINENLGYGLSTSYYNSLVKVLAKENNWFCGFNYLSKKQERTIATDEYIKNNYDNNLSINENFSNFSKKIGVSKTYFYNTVSINKLNFNTDWIHADD